MKKNDRYFGLHFDFHAKENQKYIGRYFEADLYRKLLRDSKIDFLQCDTKGHEGISSYPTKSGTPAPEIEKDILLELRTITDEFGVDLYAHHSGMWDYAATKLHPDWAMLKEDGTPSQICSSFSPYVNEQLIPQILEIAEHGLDGIWIDGECWAQIPDYSGYAQEAYQQKYGKPCPQKNEEDYSQFLQFLRDAFLEYIKQYVSKVKKIYPDFQITSNWLHTSFVPEKFNGLIDFISGDYEPNDSVNAARFDGRIMAKMGVDWDLMSWAFTPQNGVLTRKSAVQLKQEAAACISLGGGIQLYNIQYEANIQDFMIETCAEVSKFVQDRKKYCYRAKLIPQIAVFFSKKSYYANREMVYSRWINTELTDMRGNLLSVLDSGFCAEIIVTDNLLGNCSNYPVILIPNFHNIEEEIKTEIISYVENGGNLILSGPDAAMQFSDYLGIKSSEIKSAPVYLKYDDGLDGINTRFADVQTDSTTRYFMYDKNIIIPTTKKMPAVISKNYKKGKIIAFFYEFGKSYIDFYVPSLKNIVKSILNETFLPKVCQKTDYPLDIAFTEVDKKTVIQLTNLSGEHSNIKKRFIDNIPCLNNIQIFYQTNHVVKKVTKMPENTSIDFEKTENGIIINLELLEIHCSIVIE